MRLAPLPETVYIKLKQEQQMPSLLLIVAIFLILLLIISVFVAQQMDSVQKLNLCRKPKTLMDKLRESGVAPLDTDRFREIVMSGQGGGTVGSLLEPAESHESLNERPEDVTFITPDISGHRVILEGQDLQTLYAEYLSAKNLNPFDLEPEFTLGVAYIKFGQYEKAQIQFQKVIDSKPEFPGIYYYLGEALRCNGQFYEAMTAYKKSWEVDKKRNHKPGVKT